MGISCLNAPTSHVQNNLQNENVNLTIIIYVMVVVSFETDIKLLSHDVTIICG
jgi:hypothetical protein